MGDVVNGTYKAATEWQRHIVWLRVNVGFIQAELGHLSAEGHDISTIQSLLNSFDSTFEQFCQDELEVFVATRLAETGDRETSALRDRLRRLRDSFLPWLHEYNDAVEAMGNDAVDSGLPLALLRCCGAELLTGHSQFVGTVDAYIEGISHLARETGDVDTTR